MCSVVPCILCMLCTMVLIEPLILSWVRVYQWLRAQLLSYINASYQSMRDEFLASAYLTLAVKNARWNRPFCLQMALSVVNFFPFFQFGNWGSEHFSDSSKGIQWNLCRASPGTQLSSCLIKCIFPAMKLQRIYIFFFCFIWLPFRYLKYLSIILLSNPNIPSCD